MARPPEWSILTCTPPRGVRNEPPRVSGTGRVPDTTPAGTVAAPDGPPYPPDQGHPRCRCSPAARRTKPRLGGLHARVRPPGGRERAGRRRGERGRGRAGPQTWRPGARRRVDAWTTPTSRACDGSRSRGVARVGRKVRGLRSGRDRGGRKVRKLAPGRDRGGLEGRVVVRERNWVMVRARHGAGEVAVDASALGSNHRGGRPRLRGVRTPEHASAGGGGGDGVLAELRAGHGDGRRRGGL